MDGLAGVQRTRDAYSSGSLDPYRLEAHAPTPVILVFVERKEEENTDLTIEDLWHEGWLIQPDIARVDNVPHVELLVRLGIVNRLTFPDKALCFHVGKRPTRQDLT